MGKLFSFTRELCAKSAESGQVIRAAALTSSDVITWWNYIPDRKYMPLYPAESSGSVL